MQSFSSQQFDAIVDALRHGDTLLYPTDTIWGIGCDATLHDAVEKIYQIKQRDHNKSMLILVLDEWVNTGVAEVDSLLRCSQRPTTVIVPLSLLPTLPTIAPNLPASDGTIGLRIPHHPLCQQLLHALQHPIVSTSANLSGHPSPTDFNEIEPQLKERIDHCLPPLPQWQSHTSQSSRIVKYTPQGILTIRD